MEKEEAFGELEGINAKIWGCLNDANYPSPGTCTPTAQQKLCVRDNIRVEFRGSHPDCNLMISIDK